VQIEYRCRVPIEGDIEKAASGVGKGKVESHGSAGVVELATERVSLMWADVVQKR